MNLTNNFNILLGLLQTDHPGYTFSLGFSLLYPYLLYGIAMFFFENTELLCFSIVANVAVWQHL
jgi:uncharacterized membrane protein (GlpM family)